MALRAPFVFDDYGDIVDNEAVHALIPMRWAFGSTRPFVTLTFALQWVLFGPSPLAFRLFNLLVHVASALTLRALVTQLAQREGVDDRIRSNARWLGDGVALLWAVHPLHTSAVTYVVHRYESLASLLYLLALLALVRADERDARRRGYIALLGVSTLLACWSKEIAITLPVTALLIDRAYLSGSFLSALRRNLALHALSFGAALSAIAFTMTARVGSFADAARSSQGFHLVELTWRDYARSQLGVVARYLRLLVWPRGLFIDYSDWPVARNLSDVMPAALVTIGCLLAALVLLVRAPRLGTPAISFFLILSPTSTLIPLLGELVAERRLYLPSAGVVVLVGCALSLLRPALARGIAGAAVLALAIACGLRNAQYRDPVVLFGADAARSPGNVRACHHHATALSESGRHAQAITEYRRCIGVDVASLRSYEGAVKSARVLQLANPWSGDQKVSDASIADASAAETWIAKADTRINRGHRPQALEALRKAAALDPWSSGANGRLAMVIGFAPEPTEDEAREAIAAAAKAWALTGTLDSLIGAALGRCLAITGRFDQAAAIAAQLIEGNEASGFHHLAEDQREALRLYRSKQRWVPGPRKKP